jgi:ribosome-associated protein
MPITITPTVSLADHEVVLSAIRSQGAGGQNVNKVASAIHLRFDIRASSLPDLFKERLLALRDQRITDQGEIVIKAQQYRTQEQNREDAVQRLAQLIRQVTVTARPRRPTRPSTAARRKRVDSKTHRGRIKALRKTRSEG